MRTRVKICGITCAEDAREAVAVGADAIGVVYYPPSPRCASLADAAAIRASVPAFVSLVLVTVDLDPASHRQWIEALEPDLLQFHGDEPVPLCEEFALPYIKSLRMREGIDMASFESRYQSARAVLLDTFIAGTVGGTGRRFDWTRARQCRRLPVILAGGLDTATVNDALREAAPYALDVSSSLESRPGRKDHAAMAAFMEAVRCADAGSRPQEFYTESQ